MNQRARTWICTYNNPDVTTASEYLEKWHTKHGACYVTGQLEKGSTLHLQYFLQFKKQIRLGGLKKICASSHF